MAKRHSFLFTFVKGSAIDLTVMNLMSPLPQQLPDLNATDEESIIRELLPLARLKPEQEARIDTRVLEWVEKIRSSLDSADAIEKLIHRFRLTDKEGLALMALAEALPRIPDDQTADALINAKLSQGDWRAYLENYPDLLSKLAWFGLTLGKDISTQKSERSWMGDIRATALREAMRVAMKKLGGHFVMGASIEQALSKALKKTHQLERYSFDMLGEAARTQKDADRYFEAYRHAIHAVAGSPGAGNALHGPSISVKLSALHPRYEMAQQDRVMAELLPRLIELVESAAEGKVGLTIDAEEVDRLELSLPIIEKVLSLQALRGYHGFGMAVQAYQKRAPALLKWIHDHATAANVEMTVRLVKGAYWDKEIKLAQERGLAGYPVYTRKEATDIAYLACARQLFDYRGRITPQFGTHNLRTALTLKEMAGDTKDYEIQRLYGMGGELHALMLNEGIPSCVYAPVGPHQELLSYLIRRLMENSANSSFVNQLHDPANTALKLAADPVATWEGEEIKANPRIPLPAHVFGASRINSYGTDLNCPNIVAELETMLDVQQHKSWQAFPLIDGFATREDITRTIKSPSNFNHEVGQCHDASEEEAARAMICLADAFPEWTRLPVHNRANLLERFANQLELSRDTLLGLLCHEAGKTIPDALAEVREAVDLCRYYANLARTLMTSPLNLRGINGEANQLGLAGRGVFVCISPWNFPLAIMLGQVAAALITGNTVAIKPAEQTPLIAAKVVELMFTSGIPKNVVALLPGNGMVGAALTAHPFVAGVAFTGSTQTAQAINRTLAARDGAIVPLIAETGGINALIADSSALPEQVVDDVVASAFRSAGQRCSAARLLCVQDSIADSVLEMLGGAIRELRVGEPRLIKTDVGPVIDQDAFNNLYAHERRLAHEAKLIAVTPEQEHLRQGYFIRPQAWEIPNIGWLNREVFGPILHVVRYKTGELSQTIDATNALGYGLTGGVHSRIDSTIELVKNRLRVGNLYINRSVIGAVVESQPFGGEGLSGTGFKAGGPHYLLRFVTERSISTNLMAAGGDPTLLTL